MIEQVIKEKINNLYQPKVYRSPNIRASQIGHPCIRFLVLELLYPEKKSLPSLGLLKVFSLGSVYEKIIKDELENAGFQIIEQQRSFYDDKYHISGMIDFKLVYDHTVYACEVKSMSDYMFNKINSIDDFYDKKYTYLQQYPAQLQIYLYLSNLEHGLFFLKNKENNDTKIIKVDIDYKLVENLLNKAKKIWEFANTKTIPECCDNVNVCTQCPYIQFCTPELKEKKKIEFTNNEELINDLKRWDEIKAIAEEWNKLDEKIKDTIKNLYNEDTLIIADKYKVKISSYTKTLYEVPDYLKEKYKTEKEYKKVIIEKL